MREADSDTILSQSLFPGMTLVNKCTIKNNNIYCAVPQEIPTNITLPDDYLKRGYFSSDSFYVATIDKEAGIIKTKLIYRGEGVDAINLKVRDGYLYFLNRVDGGVYKLKI